MPAFISSIPQAIYTHLKWQYVALPGILLCLFSSITLASSHQNFITKTQSFAIPFPVEAIAISGDEALIAVSMRLNATDSLVQIYDRQNMKPIVRILSKGDRIQQLTFDYYTRRLALAGSEHIQLWNLETFPIQPDKPLSSKYLLDERKQDLGPGSILKFSKNSQTLMWVTKNQIQKLDLEKKPYQVSTLWIGKHASALQSFSFDVNEEWLTFSLASHKRIILAHPDKKHTKPDLDYHHFPVMKVEFIQPETILSLDTERNLIWGNANSRTKIHGVFLRNLSPNETTLDFQMIHHDRFLSILAKNVLTSKIHAHLIDKNGSQLNIIPLVNLKSFTVSPTGTYILAASSPLQIDIHQFRYHQSPQDYIRHLNEKDATEMARHYQNHLENPAGLSIANQTLKTLQNLVENLNTAIAAEKWADAHQLVEKILTKSPKNIDALKAEKLLKNHQDLVVLSKGKQQIEEKYFKQAIGILVQIPKGSPHREEAHQLIVSAETQILLRQALEKSKREIRLQNWKKAKALLIPVLEQEPNNPEAITILEEIDDHQTISRILDTLTVIVALGMLGGIGFLLILRRHQIIDWISLKETEAPSLKPPLKGRNKTTSFSDNIPEKSQFMETLQKTRNVLRLSKEADQSKTHTAQLIDFEAEVAVISKKASQPDAPFNSLTNQLLHILQTIRGFNFNSEAEQSKTKQEKQEAPQTAPNFTPKERTYYQILNVAETANFSQIKQAYHQQMKTYHPDLHQNSGFEWVKKEAEANTKLIQKAYDVLKKQQSRQQYDRSINTSN